MWTTLASLLYLISFCSKIRMSYSVPSKIVSEILVSPNPRPLAVMTCNKHNTTLYVFVTTEINLFDTVTTKNSHMETKELPSVTLERRRLTDPLPYSVQGWFKVLWVKTGHFSSGISVSFLGWGTNGDGSKTYLAFLFTLVSCLSRKSLVSPDPSPEWKKGVNMLLLRTCGFTKNVLLSIRTPFFKFDIFLHLLSIFYL